MFLLASTHAPALSLSVHPPYRPAAVSVACVLGVVAVTVRPCTVLAAAWVLEGSRLLPGLPPRNDARDDACNDLQLYNPVREEGSRRIPWYPMKKCSISREVTFVLFVLKY